MILLNESIRIRGFSVWLLGRMFCVYMSCDNSFQRNFSCKQFSVLPVAYTSTASFHDAVLPIIGWKERHLNCCRYHSCTLLFCFLGSNVSMLLACFSHVEFWHFGINMLVLWSFMQTFECKYINSICM